MVAVVVEQQHGGNRWQIQIQTPQTGPEEGSTGTEPES